MGQVQIHIAQYEVFSNGSVIAFGTEPLSFNISGLTISFVFCSKEDSSDPSIESQASSDQRKLEIKLINFDSNLGVGSNRPIEIGTLGDRKLFVLFHVKQLGNTGVRVFNYTFFLESTDYYNKTDKLI